MARILVAEDDPSVRAFVVSALTMKGHEVVSEEDGGLAAETADAEDGQFDLLLSDIKMPVMDGIALALHVGARYPDLTILLMTGFADQRERAHGLDALIYDVIAKPFTLAGLLAKVDDALNGRPVEVVSLGRQALQ
ncbi:response regulator [Devosia sp. YIM 151766]|uniref:response regulator n=1 Tax=Devosia sp. YIM 151766 TaxID=3017325 RepID=UPI00255C2B7A|nr:response regulator [Devosia sp. YIM 151766]WIY52653.1 response regulator [Devosia sp. YIM 151766]